MSTSATFKTFEDIEESKHYPIGTRLEVIYKFPDDNCKIAYLGRVAATPADKINRAMEQVGTNDNSRTKIAASYTLKLESLTFEYGQNGARSAAQPTTSNLIYDPENPAFARPKVIEPAPLPSRALNLLQ